MGKKRLGRLFGVFRVRMLGVRMLNPEGNCVEVWEGELCGGTWEGTLRGVVLVQNPKWGIENRAINPLKL